MKKKRQRKKIIDGNWRPVAGDSTFHPIQLGIRPLLLLSALLVVFSTFPLSSASLDSSDLANAYFWPGSYGSSGPAIDGSLDYSFTPSSPSDLYGHGFEGIANPAPASDPSFLSRPPGSGLLSFSSSSSRSNLDSLYGSLHESDVNNNYGEENMEQYTSHQFTKFPTLIPAERINQPEIGVTEPSLAITTEEGELTGLIRNREGEAGREVPLGEVRDVSMMRSIPVFGINTEEARGYGGEANTGTARGWTSGGGLGMGTMVANNCFGFGCTARHGRTGGGGIYPSMGPAVLGRTFLGPDGAFEYPLVEEANNDGGTLFGRSAQEGGNSYGGGGFVSGDGIYPASNAIVRNPMAGGGMMGMIGGIQQQGGAEESSEESEDEFGGGVNAGMGLIRATSPWMVPTQSPISVDEQQKYAKYLESMNRRYGIGMPGQQNGNAEGGRGDEGLMRGRMPGMSVGPFAPCPRQSNREPFASIGGTASCPFSSSGKSGDSEMGDVAAGAGGRGGRGMVRGGGAEMPRRWEGGTDLQHGSMPSSFGSSLVSANAEVGPPHVSDSFSTLSRLIPDPNTNLNFGAGAGKGQGTGQNNVANPTLSPMVLPPYPFGNGQQQWGEEGEQRGQMIMGQPSTGGGGGVQQGIAERASSFPQNVAAADKLAQAALQQSLLLALLTSSTPGTTPAPPTQMPSSPQPNLAPTTTVSPGSTVAAGEGLTTAEAAAEERSPRVQQSTTSVQALSQQIRRLPAVLYVDSRLPESRELELLLRDTYGLPLVTFYADKIDSPGRVEANLEQLTAKRGLPYLFICGTFIGSSEHIQHYHRNRQIPKLVEYVCSGEAEKEQKRKRDEKKGKKGGWTGVGKRRRRKERKKKGKKTPKKIKE